MKNSNLEGLSRRAFLGTAAAGLAGARLASAQNSQPSAAPAGAQRLDVSATGDKLNIIWIVLDTTRVDHVTPYGYRRETTPYLSQFAERATLYRNAFSTAPWTPPSHASMFTGHYTSWHGCDATTPLRLKLSKELPTLAELLTQVGYDTGNVTANMNVSKKATGIGRGFRTERVLQKMFSYCPFDKRSRFAFSFAHRWLNGERDKDKPFFLFMNLLEPHDPYDWLDNPNLASFLDADIDLARLRKDWLARGIIKGDAHRLQYFPQDITDRDVVLLKCLYDANVRYLDSQLADFMKEVEARGLDKNTLIIVTADHGESLGEHGVFQHHFCVYDTLLHVPLLIRFPQGVEAPRTVEKTVSLIDIVPTISEIAGLRWAGQDALPGVSLFSQNDPERAMWTWSREAHKKQGEPPLSPELEQRICQFWRSVRSGDYKFIWKDNGHHELYNWKNDRYEQTDLAEREPERLAKMANLLAKQFEGAPFNPQPYENDLETLDSDAREALEALGYLN